MIQDKIMMSVTSSLTCKHNPIGGKIQQTYKYVNLCENCIDKKSKVRKSKRIRTIFFPSLDWTSQTLHGA
jgi:hypothetical protein